MSVEGYLAFGFFLGLAMLVVGALVGTLLGRRR
jgi:hypothetical protein